MRSGARLRRAALTGIGLALLCGCELFSTRDAEPPDSGRSTWNTPREPADVLDNLRSAIFERDAVNYMRSFDSRVFVFEADQVALNRDPSLAEWGYEEENAHAVRLFSEGTVPRDSALFAAFTVSDETLIGDSAEVHAHYELNAGVALTGVPHHVAGTAYFFLRMGTEGYWQVYLWKDLRTDEASTWSDFKSLVR
ncbi:hypothetical protein KKH27_04725 [bacterium]|nr:hypothetical protein [bacterium]MBU1984174.1 hypothetical protein [bacterium]